MQESNIGNFVRECASKMVSEAFFGKRVVLGKPEHVGDTDKVEFKGMSAADFCLQYIIDNAKACLIGETSKAKIYSADVSVGAEYGHPKKIVIDVNGDVIGGTASLLFAPEEGFDAKEAAKAVLDSDDFREHMDDILRNVVYSGKESAHRSAYSGSLQEIGASSKRRPIICAKIADTSKSFTVEVDGKLVDVSFSSFNFSVCDHPLDGYGRSFGDWDRTSFGTDAPDLPQ